MLSIFVSQGGRLLFATDERTYRNCGDMNVLMQRLSEKFPPQEGYTLRLCRLETTLEIIASVGAQGFDDDGGDRTPLRAERRAGRSRP